MPNLPERFARWVRDGQVDTGMRVRKLPKILETPEALRLLELNGFDAAEEFLAKKDPKEQELYLILERTRARLREMTIGELVEARESSARLEILRALRSELDTVLENVERVPRGKAVRKAAAAWQGSPSVASVVGSADDVCRRLPARGIGGIGAQGGVGNALPLPFELKGFRPDGWGAA